MFSFSIFDAGFTGPMNKDASVYRGYYPLFSFLSHFHNGVSPNFRYPAYLSDRK